MWRVGTGRVGCRCTGLQACGRAPSDWPRLMAVPWPLSRSPPPSLPFPSLPFPSLPFPSLPLIIVVLCAIRIQCVSNSVIMNNNAYKLERQVAFAWASSIEPEEGTQLLIKLGLLDSAIEYALESGAFAQAFQLCQAPAAQHKMSDCHLKYAMYLEDEGAPSALTLHAPPAASLCFLCLYTESCFISLTRLWCIMFHMVCHVPASDVAGACIALASDCQRPFAVWTCGQFCLWKCPAH